MNYSKTTKDVIQINDREKFGVSLYVIWYEVYPGEEYSLGVKFQFGFVYGCEYTHHLVRVFIIVKKMMALISGIFYDTRYACLQMGLIQH